jgi:hypothetical protein
LKRGLRNAADTRQGLSPKPQSADSKEIIGMGEFAGGVTGESQRQILSVDATAVVHNPNQVHAALLDFDVDPRGSGIHGVFQKLLHHARRPFDHFSCGDFGDDV